MIRASIRRATKIRRKEMVAESKRRVRLEKLNKPLTCRELRNKIKESPDVAPVGCKYI
jgi:hypothetical protein